MAVHLLYSIAGRVSAITVNAEMREIPGVLTRYASFVFAGEPPSGFVIKDRYGLFTPAMLHTVGEAIDCLSKLLDDAENG